MPAQPLPAAHRPSPDTDACRRAQPAESPAVPSLVWDAEALAARLAPLLPGLRIEVVAHAVSTSSELLARGRAAGADGLSAAAPCVRVAEQQSGGRGRLGRAWQSQRGASLTCSLALPFAPADWSGLSLAVGVALAEALDHGGAGEHPRIRLKWPNDLWLMPAVPVAVPPASPAADVAAAAAHAAAGAEFGEVADVAPGPRVRGLPATGRKLGGILIETVALADGRRLAVIGIGLNVRPFAAPELAGSAIASLSELDAAASAPGTLARLLPPLAEALRRFERDGFAAFVDRFAARDALRGHAVVAGPRSGLADGVSTGGALRLRTPQGLHEVVGGEVSVRVQRPGEDAP